CSRWPVFAAWCEWACLGVMSKTAINSRCLPAAPAATRELVCFRRDWTIGKWMAGPQRQRDGGSRGAGFVVPLVVAQARVRMLVHQTGAESSRFKVTNMLSPDELKDGMTFILQLANAGGDRVQWVETLRGETAKRWYQIYRQSDWTALR